MKRVLIALFLLLTLVLNGCGGNPKYYDTCQEAFIAIYNTSSPDLLEISTVEFSDELTLYSIVTPVTTRGQLITCEMKQKDGKYRVLEYSYFGIPTNSTSDIIRYDGWDTASADNLTKILYQWVSTDALPEERDNRYQYLDYSFEDPLGETIRITLVYQESKINY